MEYIEASLSDIELANRIAHEVLGVSLDELPPQTRRVLAGVRGLVQQKMGTHGVPQRDVRFTRGDLRAAMAASDTQLKVHLARLAEMEYLLVHRALRGQGYVYELLYDGDARATQHLSGLIDTTALQTQGMQNHDTVHGDGHRYDARRSALNGERSASVLAQSASGRGVVGGVSGGGPDDKTAATPHGIRRSPENSDDASDSSTPPR